MIRGKEYFIKAKVNFYQGQGRGQEKIKVKIWDKVKIKFNVKVWGSGKAQVFEQGQWQKKRQYKDNC